MRRKTILLLLLGAFAAGGVWLSTVAAATIDSDRGRGRSFTDQQLQAARAATARFNSFDQALAAGYVFGGPCRPGDGGHYPNPALVADPALDVERPELLLYAPKPGGGLKLVGLEYFKADADQNLATDSDRPSLFGVPFDGPMPGHAPGQPIHYDLHVFLYESNPGGMFVLPNPNVTCS